MTGQELFRVGFNPTKDENITNLKTKFADLYNLVEENSQNKFDYYNATIFPERENKEAFDKIEQIVGYKYRVQELLETAGMYAVKMQTV